jgi:hypothetical protein
MEVRLTLRNSQGYDIALVLEPWGEVYRFAAGDELVALASGPAPVTPEIEFIDGRVIIHGWTGSTIRLFKDGHELGEVSLRDLLCRKDGTRSAKSSRQPENDGKS